MGGSTGEHPGRAETGSVLLVDDDATTRLIVADALACDGFHCEEAADGPEALAKLAASTPDVMVLDVLMPGMSGIDVLRRVRATPGGERLPIIIMTGLHDADSVQEAYSAGATDFVTKPITWLALSQRLRFVLRASRAAEELRRTREAALEASRLKSEFVRNVSHEIRTPLNGVMGMTDLLLLERLDPQAREYAEAIAGSSQQLLRIVTDILDFSKLEAGRVELEDLPFGPNELVGRLFRSAGGLARTAGVTLRLDVSRDVPEAMLGDPGRVRQVVDNLLHNAIKFTPEGSVVLRLGTAASESGGRRLVIEVEDTGIGIPEDRLESIFEPFIQVDGTITRRFGGTGLGLAISRRLARQMGGDLSATSRPGAGSTFRLTLPVREPEASACAPPDRAAADQAPLPDRLAVLVVDDHPINRRLVRHLLGVRGWAVSEAEDGAVACALAASRRFDLVLMDVQMPVMDGYEATRRIRRMVPDGARTAIVALTAHAMDGYREECLACGMDDYVTKPIRRETLFAAIGRALKTRADAAVEFVEGGPGR